MSRYIHDKTTHELIPVSGFGSRVATSVNGNTLKVHGSLLNIEGYNYGEGDITTAVQMIAPIESTLTASKAYAIGDQFVYEGLLYKATATIASGAAIVIGTNCQVSPSVTEQIKIRHMTYDATTSSSGRCSIPIATLDPSKNIVLRAYIHGTSHCILPYNYSASDGSSFNYNFIVMSSETGSRITNTSVTLQIDYIEM